MKKIRLMALLLSVTSCLMLFSVGFASWHGLVPSSASTSGSFVSYPAGLVSVDNVSLTPYSELGFLLGGTSDGTTYTFGSGGIQISDTGTFTFKVHLDEQCFTGNSLTLQFNLSFTYGTNSLSLESYCKDTDANGTFGVVAGSNGTNGTVTSVDDSPLKWTMTLSGDALTYAKESKMVTVSIPVCINSGTTNTANIFNNIGYTITPMIDVQ